jgi:mRNA-degrading endonuclease RelE of RelBE toxin-antitoxin system
MLFAFCFLIFPSSNSLFNEFSKFILRRHVSEKKTRFLCVSPLKSEPFWGKNIKKLRGYDPYTWHYRIGKLRLFYIVDQEEQVVCILTIDDRKDAYK